MREAVRFMLAVYPLFRFLLMGGPGYNLVGLGALLYAMHLGFSVKASFTLCLATTLGYCRGLNTYRCDGPLFLIYLL